MKGIVFNFIDNKDVNGDFIQCDYCGCLELVPKDSSCMVCNAPLSATDWVDGENITLTPNELHRKGYLVLSKGDKIEYEDNETGELHEVEIYDFHPDILKCVEYDLDNVICSEWEIPLSVYLSQLDSIGALSAYSKVEID